VTSTCEGAGYGLDRAAARQFGRHKGALRRTGATLADADLMIAAITLAHSAELGNASCRTEPVGLPDA